VSQYGEDLTRTGRAMTSRREADAVDLISLLERIEAIEKRLGTLLALERVIGAALTALIVLQGAHAL